jgi:hypothetical protein
MGKGNENLVYSSPWDLKSSLTCRKILRHGTSGFDFHPKECVLRIFIALKNPSPWPGSNPQTLGPVASTLTTTPPRRPLTLIVEGLKWLLTNLSNSHDRQPLPSTSLSRECIT